MKVSSTSSILMILLNRMVNETSTGCPSLRGGCAGVCDSSVLRGDSFNQDPVAAIAPECEHVSKHSMSVESVLATQCLSRCWLENRRVVSKGALSIWETDLD